MAESAGSDWRSLFCEALASSDDELQSKIDEVEGAIFFRLQELESQHDAAAERSDVQAALDALSKLRAKQSGFSRRSGVWAGHSKSHDTKFNKTETPNSSARLQNGNT